MKDDKTMHFVMLKTTSCEYKIGTFEGTSGKREGKRTW
jgi:hypothetical protein